MKNVKLTDIINMANLDDKEKINLASYLLDEVAMNLPDSAMAHQLFLSQTIKDLEKIG